MARANSTKQDGLMDWINKTSVTRHLQRDGSFYDVKNGIIVFAMTREEVSNELGELISWTKL